MKDIAINNIIAKAISEESLEPFEQAQLDAWLSVEGNLLRYEELKNQENLRQYLKELDGVDLDKWKQVVDQKIAQHQHQVPVVRSMVWRYAAAVAAVLCVSVAAYLWFTASPPVTKPVDTSTVAQQTHDIAPGQTKALLTLDDGSTVVLDTASAGQLATQGSTVISREGGQLVYKAGDAATGKGTFYNTLTTARGETFTLILPDGSEVILNSASSVRYPTAFNSNERRVEVTGEAFFTVKHQAGKPFIVRNPSSNMDVTVYGTEFNVHTYGDEQPAVTLIKGSVGVTLDSKTANGEKPSQMIQPGQQVLVTSDARLVLNKAVNLDEVLAWKKGRFYFSHSNITTVMKQLERWYNIEVVYEGAKPTLEFGGELQRSFTLAQVIKALEHTGVKFRIEGRKLIVLQ